MSVPELERAGLVLQPLAPTSRRAGEAPIIVLREQRQESKRVHEAEAAELARRRVGMEQEPSRDPRLKPLCGIPSAVELMFAPPGRCGAPRQKCRGTGYCLCSCG